MAKSQGSAGNLAGNLGSEADRQAQQGQRGLRGQDTELTGGERARVRGNTRTLPVVSRSPGNAGSFNPCRAFIADDRRRVRHQTMLRKSNTFRPPASL